MLTGYNTDIRHRGVVYHVQTEDGGEDNPHIVSLVYRGGRILSSRKSSYAQHLGSENLMATVRGMLEDQHRNMLRAIVAGAFDQEEKAPPVAAAPPPREERPPEAPQEEKSLDQVILEYLATEIDGK